VDSTAWRAPFIYNRTFDPEWVEGGPCEAVTFVFVGPCAIVASITHGTVLAHSFRKLFVLPRDAWTVNMLNGTGKIIIVPSWARVGAKDVWESFLEDTLRAHRGLAGGIKASASARAQPPGQLTGPLILLPDLFTVDNPWANAPKILPAKNGFPKVENAAYDVRCIPSSRIFTALSTPSLHSCLSTPYA
jgi:hypothetical protein